MMKAVLQEQYVGWVLSMSFSTSVLLIMIGFKLMLPSPLCIITVSCKLESW